MPLIVGYRYVFNTEISATRVNQIREAARRGDEAALRDAVVMGIFDRIGDFFLRGAKRAALDQLTCFFAAEQRFQLASASCIDAAAPALPELERQKIVSYAEACTAYRTLQSLLAPQYRHVLPSDGNIAWQPGDHFVRHDFIIEYGQSDSYLASFQFTVKTDRPFEDWAQRLQTIDPGGPGYVANEVVFGPDQPLVQQQPPSDQPDFDMPTIVPRPAANADVPHVPPRSQVFVPTNGPRIPRGFLPEAETMLEPVAQIIPRPERPSEVRPAPVAVLVNPPQAPTAEPVVSRRTDPPTGQLLSAALQAGTTVSSDHPATQAEIARPFADLPQPDRGDPVNTVGRREERESLMTSPAGVFDKFSQFVDSSNTVLDQNVTRLLRSTGLQRASGQRMRRYEFGRRAALAQTLEIQLTSPTTSDPWASTDPAFDPALTSYSPMAQPAPKPLPARQRTDTVSPAQTGNVVEQVSKEPADRQPVPAEPVRTAQARPNREHAIRRARIVKIAEPKAGEVLRPAAPRAREGTVAEQTVKGKLQDRWKSASKKLYGANPPSDDLPRKTNKVIDLGYTVPAHRLTTPLQTASTQMIGGEWPAPEPVPVPSKPDIK